MNRESILEDILPNGFICAGCHHPWNIADLDKVATAEFQMNLCLGCASSYPFIGGTDELHF
jgi:hypothetical protein